MNITRKDFLNPTIFLFEIFQQLTIFEKSVNKDFFWDFKNEIWKKEVFRTDLIYFNLACKKTLRKLVKGNFLLIFFGKLLLLLIDK